MRRLKFFLWVLVLSPLVISSLEFYQRYYVYPQRKAIFDNGVEVVATIEGGKRTERRGTTIFHIDLTWRDNAGETRRAEQVVITDRLAEKIVRGNSLITDSVRIKYLESDKTAKPLVLANLPPSGPVAANMFEATMSLLLLLGPVSMLSLGGLYYLRLRNAS